MSIKPMTMSGFCQWPSSIANSHELCSLDSCTCDCHPKAEPALEPVEVDTPVEQEKEEVTE